MKDRTLLKCMLLLFALEILSGFVFAHTINEFIFNQASRVLLAYLLFATNKDKKESLVLLSGYLVLNVLEEIDEIRYRNTQTRFEDYLFLSVIFFFVVLSLYKLKKTKEI